MQPCEYNTIQCQQPLGRSILDWISFLHLLYVKGQVVSGILELGGALSCRRSFSELQCRL